MYKTWFDLIVIKRLSSNFSSKIQECRRVLLIGFRMWVYIIKQFFNFIYNHHSENPSRALSILGGSVIIPGELVGQIAASSDIAYSVGAEIATKLYIDPISGKAKKGSGGAGPGSPRRLTAAYLNQIDLTVDYRGMSANEILKILPEEFSRFK